MINEKVLDKVKKLLALADNEAVSEGERDNALRMAHNLLAKHNLDMIDLAEHTKEESREEILLQTYQMAWTKTVCHQIAKLFFCKYFSGYKLNATKGNHHFVGKESNATTACLMSEWIIKSVLKEGRTRFGSNLCPQTRSFGVGVAYSLIERVKELMQADVNNTPGTGLVLVSLYQTELTENENFIKASGTQLKTDNRGSKDVHVSAFKSGVIHGNNIPLNNQVGANKKPELLN